MAGITEHEIVKVGPVLRSTSPLVDRSQKLEEYPDYETMDRIIGKRVETTFVPMRNAFFLTLAANIAYSFGCTRLVTGVDEEDDANYPDCRESFIRSQERTINEALGTDNFRILTPLIHFPKLTPCASRSHCRAAWRPWPGRIPATRARSRPAANVIPASCASTALTRPAFRIRFWSAPPA